MKRLNVKKIAALAIGALFVGSAAVSASKLMYEDTTLVNDNGVPQVSVLIPGASAAAMTDGVAGARIASKLAAESYKEVTYTAELTGEAVCGASNGTEGACPVTDKSVSMTITSPGITGVYTISPAIYDIFDAELLDRDTTVVGNDQLDGDEEDADATPFYLAVGNANTLYKIGDDFTPFADFSFEAAKFDVTEKQAFFIDGTTDIDADSVPLGDIDGMIYSVKFFTENKIGLPVCINDDVTADDWAGCLGVDATAETVSKRPKIKFLGDDWILSDMQPARTAANLVNEDTRLRGGSVTLAKEAAYGIISVGEQLTTIDHYVQLDDISVGVGAGFAHPAIVSLIDKATGEVVEQTQINPGASLDMGPNDDVRVHVYQTAPGITLTSKWAEIAVYEEEWELRDADNIDDDENEDWDIRIYWKDKDADGAGAGEEDNLREIVLYNDDHFDLEEGDTVNIVEDPAAFDFTYNGLDSESRTSLTFDIDSDYEFEDCANAGNYVNDDSAGTQVMFLKVTIGGDYEFEGSTDGTTNSVEDGETIYIAIDDDAEPNNAATASVGQGDVWVESATGCFDLEAATIASTVGGASDSMKYDVDILGDTGGVWFDTYAAAGVIPATGFGGAATSNLAIVVAEEVGEIESAEDLAFFALNLECTVAAAAADDCEFNYVDNTILVGGIDTTENAHMHYWTGTYDPAGGVAPAAIGTGFTAAMTQVDKEIQEGFISLRGSKFNDMDAEGARLDIANDQAKMSFSFKTHGDDAEPNTATWLAHEGDSDVFGDTTITVDTITCTTGACTVSGAGSAGCAYTGGLEAVISGEGAASVAGMAPGTVNPSSLIMLDTEGASLSGNFVSVAGPVVNTVTARELTGANAHDFNAQAVLVKQIAPGKVIVAGRDAADTLTAADQFIAAMQRV